MGAVNTSRLGERTVWVAPAVNGALVRVREVARRREGQRARRGRPFAAVLVVVVVLAAAVVILEIVRTPSTASNVAENAPVASAQTRARIVSFANSELGYSTDPSTTYCNKFSAFWFSGPADCGNTNRNEQWCADFAVWAWKQAGVPLVYQYINGDLNSSSASFYEWGLRHGTWHPLGSNYVPQPGDVAVYGLDAGALVAQHVAIVESFSPGSKGPNAINGDGDHTGFSRVEYQSDEYNADVAGTTTALLAGYVAPNG